MLSAIIAYFIIPAYTLFFVRDTPWFSCNLSVIGSTAERQDGFFVLGLLLGFYFVIKFKQLLQIFSDRKFDKILVYSAFGFLLSAVIIPYLPETLPFWSFLHICFAMTASLLLLFCLGRTIFRLSGLSQESAFLMEPYRLGLFLTCAVSVLLFFINDGIISTTLEIYFILSTVWMTERLSKKAHLCCQTEKAAECPAAE